MIMKALLITGKMKAAFVSGLFVIATTSLCLAADFVNVTRDGVNLRSGPGTNFDVLFELPAGYPLKVLETKGDWLKVSDFENDRGYIHSSMTNKSGSVIVKVSEANVRSEPDAKATKVGSVSKEVILKKVGQKGGWVQISHPQLNGWIFKKLIWP